MTALDWAALGTALALSFGVMAWLCGLWMGWWSLGRPRGTLEGRMEENRKLQAHRKAQVRR
jgi:hypothetical protein